MKIEGKEYSFQDVSRVLTVPDCNVLGPNKLGTGNGEAKFYFGSKTELNAFALGKPVLECFFLKSDLMTYMQTAQKEYSSPTQNYAGKAKMPALWAERVQKIAKLPEICALAEKYGARVMVDDAHGLGVLGAGGRGTPFHYGLENEVDIFMGTFSKSLASLGGYLAGDAKVVDYVRHHSRPFIFSASLPPANAAVALAALRHLEAHPELPLRLKALSEYARAGFQARGVRIRESALGVPTPIIPLYTYTTEATLVAVKKIFELGVYVNPVLPPATPEGEALLRTSFMATHTEAQLDEAMDVITRVMKDAPA